MHPAHIQAAIIRSGSSQVAIAKNLQVTASAVWNVIHSKGRSDAIADRIALLVDLPRSTLWPSLYGHEAPPAAPRVKPHYRLRLNGSVHFVSIRGCA